MENVILAQVTVPEVSSEASTHRCPDDILYSVRIEIPLHKIRNNQDTGAVRYCEQYQRLRESIKSDGRIMNPIYVMKEESNFSLVSGLMRLEAARELGYETISAYVTDEVPALVQYKDNALRGALTAIREAEIIYELKKSGPGRGYTQVELGELLGLAQNTVSEILKVMKLPLEVRSVFRYREDLSRAMILGLLRQCDAITVEDVTELLQGCEDKPKREADPVQVFIKHLSAIRERAEKLPLHEIDPVRGAYIASLINNLCEPFSEIFEAIHRNQSRQSQDSSEPQHATGDVIDAEVIY